MKPKWTVLPQIRTIKSSTQGRRTLPLESTFPTVEGFSFENLTMKTKMVATKKTYLNLLMNQNYEHILEYLGLFGKSEN